MNVIIAICEMTLLSSLVHRLSPRTTTMNPNPLLTVRRHRAGRAWE